MASQNPKVRGLRNEEKAGAVLPKVWVSDSAGLRAVATA